MNSSARPFPSIFSVNLLYLVTILLNLVLGSLVQSWHLVWGLIASEGLLILLPTLAFLRLRHIPLREGLRLKPIRPLVGVICILLGFTTFLFVIIIDAVLVQITGLPVIPIPVESMPTGTLELIGFFFAWAVVAPLCEEPLFRGVIQGSYEKQRPARFAIIIVAVMFAFWHFQLTGLGGLLPAAFILGFVAWRTGSLYASILVHFSLNAASAVHSILTLSGGGGLPFLGLPAAVAGLVATAALIYAIWRLQPMEKQPASAEGGKPRAWWWNYSPLAVAGLLFLGVTAMTLKTSQITLSQAGYNEIHIAQVVESRFRITNQAGDEVGEMNCTITPQGSDLRLDCAGQVSAYQVKTDAGDFKDEDHTVGWSATWDTNTMVLIDFNFEQDYAEVGKDFRAALKNGRLVVEDSTGMQEVALSPSDLVQYEWAWRVNALKSQVFTTIQAPFAYMLWWDDETGNSHPALRDEMLRLHRSEQLVLPAGEFRAWQASLGGQSAWYASGHAGPVRIDDGTLIYELEE